MATDMGNFQKTKDIIWPITWKRDAKRGATKESMIDSCEIMFSASEWFNTVEMKKFVVHGMFLQNNITPIICQKQNSSTTGKIGGSLSISRETTPNQWETFLFQTSVVYLRTFTPRSWRRPTRARSFLEVQTMETGIEFFLHLVAMERILVVFLRIQRKSIKEDASKGLWSNGAIRCLQNFGENLRRMAFKNSFYFVTDRSFTADGGLL